MEPFSGFMRHVSVEPVAGDETLILVPDPAPDTDLAALYRRERDAMVWFARMLTGSAAVAEEVVQEAFLKLHQHAAQPQNPQGYLRAIVANLAGAIHDASGSKGACRPTIASFSRTRRSTRRRRRSAGSRFASERSWLFASTRISPRPTSPVPSDAGSGR